MYLELVKIHARIANKGLSAAINAANINFIYNDIIPLNDEEKMRLDEAYKAYLLGLIFGVFDIIPESESSKAIYKYTKQEGITVKRVEQLGIESRLINRLFEEQGKDSLRYRILKDAEAVQNRFFKAGKFVPGLQVQGLFPAGVAAYAAAVALFVINGHFF